MSPRATWSRAERAEWRRTLPLAAFVGLMARHVGRENALPAKDIVLILNIRDSYPERSVRELANLAIEHGYPIAAATHSTSGRLGYFVLRDEGELRAYTADLHSRIRGIQKKIEALTEAARCGPKQPGLFGAAPPTIAPGARSPESASSPSAPPRVATVLPRGRHSAPTPPVATRA
jgi:hypothetical protein